MYIFTETCIEIMATEKPDDLSDSSNAKCYTLDDESDTEYDTILDEFVLDTPMTYTDVAKAHTILKDHYIKQATKSGFIKYVNRQLLHIMDCSKKTCTVDLYEYDFDNHCPIVFSGGWSYERLLIHLYGHTFMISSKSCRDGDEYCLIFNKIHDES